MKYLIAESQFDNLIFKYIDLKGLIQIEINNRIYFIISEENKYAQIRYSKNDGSCYINKNLISDISKFFSLQSEVSYEVIGRWVEHTLKVETTSVTPLGGFHKAALRIPSE